MTYQNRKPANEGHCRNCGELMVWLTSATTGRPFPVNPVPVLGGNVRREGNTAHMVKADPEVRLYTSHFATCPGAAGFRKRK